MPVVAMDARDGNGGFSLKDLRSEMKGLFKSVFSSSSKERTQQPSVRAGPHATSKPAAKASSVTTLPVIRTRERSSSPSSSPFMPRRRISITADADWDKVEVSMRLIQAQVYNVVGMVSPDTTPLTLTPKDKGRRNSDGSTPVLLLHRGISQGLATASPFSDGGKKRSFDWGADNMSNSSEGSVHSFATPRQHPLDEARRSSASSQSSDVLGSSLSRHARSLEEEFTLGSKLGAGGFSVVLSAREKSTGRAFAAKMVNLEGCNEKQLKEVIAEAGLALGLHHPSIIHHEDVFVDRRTKDVCFLMDRMNGGSLQDHLMQHPRILSSRHAAQCFRTLMSGLSHIHARDIVHCDIKPDNILLPTPNDFAKSRLSDFGLAVRLEDDHQIALTRVRGTEGFIPPELYRARVAKSAPPETPAIRSLPAHRRLSAARLLDSRREGDCTPTREAEATPAPPAPPAQKLEVVYTTAVDIWSAAVTLYSMLGGNWQKPSRQVSSWERESRGKDVHPCEYPQSYPKYLFENDVMWMRVWGVGVEGDHVRSPAEHDEIVDLISWMLHPWPAKRPTAEDVLRHPWVVRHCGLA
mmetsp:Transcript_26655/g.85529  ORF Transcript_26655/g.85529 Transcript_26655/m.85529 type:complete len:580 (+) Transcript_26655:276-2015(+)